MCDCCNRHNSVCGVMLYKGGRVAASGISFADCDSDNAVFVRLEQLTVGSNVRPTIDCFTSRTDNTLCPVSAVGGNYFIMLPATTSIHYIRRC